jgi:FtsZ-binding cell division protein ZapB
MATTKTKGTNSKIKELKGVEDARPVSISEEQLKKVQELVNSINRAQMEIGSNEVKKHGLMHQVSGIQEKLNEVQAELKEQYGTVDININDGMINYDVKADS